MLTPSATAGTSGKATQIDLFSLRTPQMRAFHLSWFAFFLCFLAWFGIAPLMAVIREEMGLTKEQVGWTIIGSVAGTVFVRLLVGWLCDRIGPRLAYTWLLVLGSLPVMGVGFARDFETLLLFRIAIGAIGASFVITQYHTSLMFAPNVIGTASATTAGWGNLGGGMTQLVMPFLFGSVFMGTFGLSAGVSWRACMVCAGAICLLTGIAYCCLTQDTPQGNLKDLRAAGKIPAPHPGTSTFLNAATDYRAWALFLIYGTCFGIELTIHNIAVLYFMDYFAMDLKTAGLTAACFGSMNLFARTLGGYLSDCFDEKIGLKGRVLWLFAALFCEGLALMLFSQMSILATALPVMLVFALFVKMSEGATYSVVPFLNRQATGSVAGIVGAGGNAGAVAAGFLFKSSLDWPTALLILGAIVTVTSALALTIRFTPAQEQESSTEMARAAGPDLGPHSAPVA